jgi:hypothetical protein
MYSTVRGAASGRRRRVIVPRAVEIARRLCEPIRAAATVEAKNSYHSRLRWGNARWGRGAAPLQPLVSERRLLLNRPFIHVNDIRRTHTAAVKDVLGDPTSFAPGVALLEHPSWHLSLSDRTCLRAGVPR